MKQHPLLILVVLPGLLAAETEPADRTGRINICQSGFTDNPDEIRTLEQLTAAQLRAMRSITLRQANIFHQRFVEQCLPQLPDDVSIQYMGLLNMQSGSPLKAITRRVVHQDNIAFSLDWHVQADVVIFDLWISSGKNQWTVETLEIEGVPVHVNVTCVEGNATVDKQLKSLGDLSVRQTLEHLKNQRTTARPASER